MTREVFALFKGNDGNYYAIGLNEVEDGPNAPATPGKSDPTVLINQEHNAMKKECFEGFSEGGEVVVDLEV